MKPNHRLGVSRLRPWRRWLRVEQLESRHLLTGFFGPEQVITSVAITCEACRDIRAADLDGDGDQDLVAVGYALSWWENDGDEQFTKHTFDLTVAGSAPLEAAIADIDADGDLDIATVIEGAGELVIVENLGAADFQPHVITGLLTPTPCALDVADFDLDGDYEIVVGTADGELFLLEQTSTLQFGSQLIGTTNSPGTGVAVADVDRDGDLDVAYNGFGWLENLGTGVFADHRLGSWSDFEIHVADVDNDADYDLVMGPGLFLNDGAQNFEGQYLGNQDGFESHAVNLNGDGFVDILVGSHINYGQQDATYAGQRYTETDLYDTFPVDLDGDGDLDVLGIAEHAEPLVPTLGALRWYENLGDGVSFQEHDIAGYGKGIPGNVAVVDVNTDGKPDVASSYYGRSFTWFEATNSDFERRFTFRSGYGPANVYAVNMDNDSYPDVVDSDFTWYESNEEGELVYITELIAVSQPSGMETFDADADGDTDFGYAKYGYVTAYQNDNGVLTGATVFQDAFTHGLFSADVDQDGDMDLLSSTRDAEDNYFLNWHENQGDGTEYTNHRLVQLNTFIDDDHAAFLDLEGDGDIDILYSDGSEIQALVNDGFLSFSSLPFDGLAASFLSTRDADQDGDNDILAVSESDNIIAWFENRSGGDFQYRLVSMDSVEPKFVDAVDMDLDGDLDLISSSRGDEKIAWYENLPDVDFTNDGIVDVADIDLLTENIVSGLGDPAVFDINNDALVDVDDQQRWLEIAGAINLPDRSPYLPGDANLNGAVGQRDFRIWNAHKFTVTGRWSEGDFNADGFTDGKDLLIWNSHKAPQNIPADPDSFVPAEIEPVDPETSDDGTNMDLRPVFATDAPRTNTAPPNAQPFDPALTTPSRRFPTSEVMKPAAFDAAQRETWVINNRDWEEAK